MTGDTDPSRKVINLDDFRHIAHAEIKEKPELTDFFTTQFPQEGSDKTQESAKDRIIASLEGEITRYPTKSAKNIVHRVLEELSVVDFLATLMEGPGRVDHNAPQERVDRLKDVLIRLKHLEGVYEEWKKDGGPTDHDLELSLGTIGHYSGNSDHLPAIIQVLLGLRQAFVEKPTVQDAFWIGVLLLEEQASPGEFEE